MTSLASMSSKTLVATSFALLLTQCVTRRPFYHHHAAGAAGVDASAGQGGGGGASGVAGKTSSSSGASGDGGAHTGGGGQTDVGGSGGSSVGGLSGATSGARAGGTSKGGRNASASAGRATNEGGASEGGAGADDGAGAGGTLSYPIQLSLGDAGICALISNGHVYCLGQPLGNGSDKLSMTAVEVSDIDNATKVVCGGNVACALLADRTVKCWGDDSAGQIDGMMGTSFARPVAVDGVNNVTDLITDGWVTCARLAGGTVRCWGRADANTNVASLPNTIAPLQPATGLGGDLCAILEDQSVACWEGLGKPSTMTGLANVTQVAGDCALSNDGSVRCWGRGFEGQIGNGSTDDQTSPQLVQQLGTATEIVAAGTHVCAKLSDASVACWGTESTIQHGDLPVPIGPIGPVAHLAAGPRTTCAIETDHTVKCWG